MGSNEKLKKNESIQVFRALMFFWIFCAHIVEELQTLNPRVFNPLHVVEIGVTPFFVLSGFLLMARHTEDEPLSLKACFGSMMKRISRMYPLHIVTMLFVFFIWTARYWHGGVLAERFHDKLLVPLFFHSFLIQSWYPVGNILMGLNAPSWYVSTAAFLYFIFPVMKKLILKFKGKGRWLLLAAFLAFRYFLEIIRPKFPWASPDVFPIFRITDLFVSCLAGAVYFENKEKLKFSNLASFFLQLAAIAVGVLLSFVKPENYPFLICAFFKCNVIKILLSVLWIYFFMEGKGILRFLTVAPLVALGNISGVAYLIHAPVMDLQGAIRSVLNLRYASWNLPSLYAVAAAEFAVTILFSILWIGMEKKIHSKKAAKLEKAKQA